MSEAGFILVVDIAVRVEILLYAVCMAAFFYPFMAGKKEQRKSRINKVLMVFLTPLYNFSIKKCHTGLSDV